jgi:predicted  nucleic acid-binding Zn-ribbon protein
MYILEPTIKKSIMEERSILYEEIREIRRAINTMEADNAAIERRILEDFEKLAREIQECNNNFVASKQHLEEQHNLLATEINNIREQIETIRSQIDDTVEDNK